MSIVRWLVIIVCVGAMSLVAWSAKAEEKTDEAYVSNEIVCGSQETPLIDETTITDFIWVAKTNSKAAFAPGDKETSTTLGIMRDLQYEIVRGDYGVLKNVGGEIWIRVSNGFVEGWEKLSHGCLVKKNP